MIKRNDVTPEDGESIKSWTDRYHKVKNKHVTRKVLIEYTHRFPMVDISEENDIKGLGLSEKIQRAITLCQELFPNERDFVWLGTMQFWFSSSADAITFKLHWSHHNNK